MSTPAGPIVASAPDRQHDLPASIVLAVVFFLCGVGMILRFRQSKFRFRMNILFIGFCMSRMVTFSLRSAWSANPTNRNLAIAATVFVRAGVILLVVANMQLVFRLTKSLRPKLHEHRLFTRFALLAQLFIVPLLIMTIVPAIQSILTSDSNVRAKDTIVIKISATYIAVYACLPVLLIPAIYLLLKPSSYSIVQRVPLRCAFLLYLATLIGLEMALKCGNAFKADVMTPWYGTRWGFYVFTPMLELLAVVPVLLINLPLVFGDSNDAVLQAINGRLSEEGGSEKGKGDDVLHALQQTTTTWKPNKWTSVASEQGIRS